MKKCIIILLILINAVFSYGQVGGKRSFEFLNLPTNARSAGLGGVVISATADDPTMFLANPALLSEEDHNHLSVSHLGFYADIKYNTFTYARTFDKTGIVGVGIQRMSYGQIESYDPAGNSVGTFDAAETAITFSNSHRKGPFTLGGSLKVVQSSIYTFSSTALMLDIGGVFTHPEQELAASLVIKNLGVMLSDYTASGEGKLPFDVQAGVTFKPEHMPFRFTFTAYNLARSNVTFFDQNISDPEEQPGQVDKIFRHLNIGTEIILGKNFNVRLGYNHLMRKELRLKNTAGGAGFSFGFMLRIKAFELGYTNTAYHADGGRSFFTITTNLNRILKKKNIK